MDWNNPFRRFYDHDRGYPQLVQPAVYEQPAQYQPPWSPPAPAPYTPYPSGTPNFNAPQNSPEYMQAFNQFGGAGQGLAAGRNS
ncbi:MAG: hypothetical protein F9K17_11035 [Phycisphaerae bacterium]|nr:MAG: hypothetical protein F9K17_11035 [Phycisphaerae bacterium]